ncbi:endolytic transglycosylase MltG [Mangrovactinospora gilvigrisea]|nr:endolytic transglycosylase MltG [Mangrovactinospora gilvigrisea]
MDHEPRGRRAERNSHRRRKKRRRRSGCALFVALLVLVAVVAVGGWYGYRFYQEKFGAAPDYVGDGSGSVTVEIPDGAGTAQIADILYKDAVVKSAGAFLDAAKKQPSKAATIQPGTYPLHRHMSGVSAFSVLTDPKNINALTIPEGTRASKVYQLIDEKLKAKPGTTEKAATTQDIGLPAYAKHNPEGFLWPTRYTVGQNTTPAALLKQMVQQAESEYQQDGIDQAAARLNLSPYQMIIIGSLVQAEAQQDADYGKVARVIDNRIGKGMKLEFDSTINYALNRSTLTTTSADQRTQSPYNTYLHTGLPPGPIGNPGHQAMEAAVNPTPGDWLYFVTVKPGDTRFTASFAQHQKNVAEFNQYQKTHGGQ